MTAALGMHIGPPKFSDQRRPAQLELTLASRAQQSQTYQGCARGTGKSCPKNDSTLIVEPACHSIEKLLMPLPVQFQIQASPAPLTFNLSAGSVTIVAGANGVGKSALLFQMYRSLGHGNSAYYPGHRQIIFNNNWDSLQQDIETLMKNLYAHPNSFSRYKGAWSEDQFKSVVRKLQNMET